MVNYKVRSFYEKDTGTAGADVIIYDDSGDVVDTLLITTESTYNDLVEQLEGIDEKYLDRTDVLNILQNTSNEIVAINATMLNGQSADFYAKNNHNHDSVYAPLNHVNSLSTEGVVGHAKIINNVSRTSFVNGEALAAYQGKLLSDRINTMQPKLEDTGWDSWPITQANSGRLSDVPICRKYGKIVILRLQAEVYQKITKNSVVFTLKSPYKPSHYVLGFGYKEGTGDCVTYAIGSDGNLVFGTDMAMGTKIRINESFFTS